MHRASILAIAALLIPAAVVSQTDTSVGIDSMGLVFRGTIDSVAAVAGHGSLRDHQLPRGTLREVRVYIGFGIGYPQKAVMIREDSIGVHGWLGLWWPGAKLDYRIPDGTNEDYAEARKERAGWVELVREHARKSGCEAFEERPGYETCTIPGTGIDWAATLRQLDSLGIARLPQQRVEFFGNDGITIVVEYCDGDGYRAYSYWNPDVKSQIPNERAAARIMELIDALNRDDGSRSRGTHRR